MRQASTVISISELQWAHATLVRLITLVNLHGLLGGSLNECLVHMTRSAELLEDLIQEHLTHARQNRDDIQ